ncbi:MAG: MmgE/PrpD family protein, partial [Burkholderiaceae bacterium]
MAANLVEPQAFTVMPTDDTDAAVTQHLAQWAAGVRTSDVPPLAMQWSRHALLDWFAVTIAGASEPLVQMLMEEYASPPDAKGNDASCTLFGLGRRARAHDAALINGAAGHALDFDDVNPRMGGHPTAPVAPVVLAIGEKNNLSGAEVLRAFATGYEVECRLGEMCGPSHYQHGFHATATMGAFGAAAAACNLTGQNAEATANALGMAAAQAAGLKSMFGTMTKPLHAGKAALNGLMSAQLAARGFTANQTGIECAQGFAATQVPVFKPSVAPIDNNKLTVQENLFKYHAACYLTHSAIEAIRVIREEHQIGLDDMQTIEIQVPESHKKVCDIREPETGLNIKFSIRHLAAMALDGQNTASLDMYSDQNANDARYVDARRRVELAPTPHSDSDLFRSAIVVITTKDGRSLRAEYNVAIPA